MEEAGPGGSVCRVGRSRPRARPGRKVQRLRTLGAALIHIWLGTAFFKPSLGTAEEQGARTCTHRANGPCAILPSSQTRGISASTMSQETLFCETQERKPWVSLSALCSVTCRAMRSGVTNDCDQVLALTVDETLNLQASVNSSVR